MLGRSSITAVNAAVNPNFKMKLIQATTVDPDLIRLVCASLVNFSDGPPEFLNSIDTRCKYIITVENIVDFMQGNRASLTSFCGLEGGFAEQQTTSMN